MHEKTEMRKRETITHLKERIHFFRYNDPTRIPALQTVLNLIREGKCKNFDGINLMGLHYNHPVSQVYYYEIR